MTISLVRSELITWEVLPADFVLEDEPVDNINQPLLAAALTDSLQVAGRLLNDSLTFTNYGLCAKLNQQFVLKAPDWGYVNSIQVPRQQVKRSYTPNLQGDPPLIVMEFLSDTPDDEYSVKPTYPPGKWYFYQKILQVPYYAIFDPDPGRLEVYQLATSTYQIIETEDEYQRVWIPEMDLFLGVWQGIRENRDGYWLRWWDVHGSLLLWGSELASWQQERADQERERADQQQERADRLAERLRSMGIDPDAL